MPAGARLAERFLPARLAERFQPARLAERFLPAPLVERLYMRLFARAHPDEVRGLVLVDAVYPREIKRTDDFPWTTRLAGRLLFSRTVWQEIEQIDATGEAVLRWRTSTTSPSSASSTGRRRIRAKCCRWPSISASAGRTGRRSN